MDTLEMALYVLRTAIYRAPYRSAQVNVAFTVNEARALHDAGARMAKPREATAPPLFSRKVCEMTEDVRRFAPASRICVKCGVEQPLERFSPYKSGGCRKVCKGCRVEQNKQYRPADAYARYWSWSRLFHPKMRNEQRKRNYAIGRRHAVNSGDGWTLDHLRRITSDGRPCDRELAKELGRSVAAIQGMRVKAKKMEVVQTVIPLREAAEQREAHQSPNVIEEMSK